MFFIRSASVARAIVHRAGRTYATTTASTKPPIQLFGVDGTYASALYTASAKAQTLVATEKSLLSLKSLLQKDPKLEAILGSPTLNAGDKSGIIAEITKLLSPDKTVKSFLEVLAGNNRLGLLGGVIDKFSTLMSAHRGEVKAVITSASPLEAKFLDRLKIAINGSEHVGNKILKVENKVNPDILGGLIVEVGERTIDLSVSAKVSKLNKLLTDEL